jgi:hypothetical protein
MPVLQGDNIPWPDVYDKITDTKTTQSNAKQEINKPINIERACAIKKHYLRDAKNSQNCTILQQLYWLYGLRNFANNF